MKGLYFAAVCLLLVVCAYGNAISECNMVCPNKYEPLCGSNGWTYINQCTFDSAVCMSKDILTLAHKGECKFD
uniref:Turripeptide-like/Protease inhibitor CTX28 n=1 Tax=Colubraria reticulata TaxID=604273 RepID=A0A330LCC5_9CAEN|nr:Turripeptide-like/Protease inhibitor CTX28 [Colubraria reticulata]